MNRHLVQSFCVLIACTLVFSCVTKRKKNETTKFGKFYHNTTAYYNGYWNANELLKESMKTLRLANVDNYNQILEVEDFVSVDNPKMVKAEMDKIIDKVSTAAQLHEPSEWVDDCYVMLAQAQYLKQEYETAEETLQYFQEDFNPSNPYGRNYKSKKLSSAEAKKRRESDRKEESKAKEKSKKMAAETKKAKAEAKEDEKKEQQKIKEDLAKDKAEARKDAAKQREADKKEREKEKKQKAKDRKKSASRSKRVKDGAKTNQDSSAVKPKVLPPAPKNTQVKDKIIAEPKATVVNPIADDAKVNDEPANEEAYVAPKPPKPTEDKTAYSKGLLWLAKTYIKRENWFASEVLLNKLENTLVNDDIKAELPATYANLYIKQKKYDEAIPKLIEAAELESDKQLKSRYYFIAGQISQLKNNNTQALEYFANAKKYAKDIKMEFMAELAAAKNGIKTGKRSKEDVISNLKSMLKEDKNKTLLDQIYFTLGDIELSEGNDITAIDYFQKSIASNSGDQKLKSEAYYTVATTYYQKEKYLEASLYYDSTSTVMSTSDERFANVNKYKDNLKDIAKNISIINDQDTLIYFAGLTKDEKEKQIPPYISRNSSKIVANNTPKEVNSGMISKQLAISSQVNFGNSTFFAYNKNNIQKGKDDFKKLWGSRALDDDWRRNSKSSNNVDVVSNVKVDEATAKESMEENEDYQACLKLLPDNPMKKKDVDDKISGAMFELGKLFREKIENFAQSASTLEGLQNRFGPTQYELDAFYYLYLDYLDMGKNAAAKEYSDKIIRKYPDSKYSIILSDPDYFAKSKKEASKPETFYKTVYGLYEAGRYEESLNAINTMTGIPDESNPYLAKLALIKAMCIGNREGKDAYIKALSTVISGFPNTPEQSKAKEIMRFLSGDNSAFKTANVQDVDKMFTKEDSGVHYVTIITYGLTETDHVNVKVAISEYNKTNFKVERLQMGDASLSIEDNAQIILIRKFNDRATADAYYKKVSKDKDAFIGKQGLNVDIFPISQSNYRKLISQQSAVEYRVFFESNYGDK